MNAQEVIDLEQIMCSASMAGRRLCWRAARAARSTTPKVTPISTAWPALPSTRWATTTPASQAMGESLATGHAAREQSLPHGAPCPAGPVAVRDQLCRQGALLQQRRRGQRGRVQVCPPLRPRPRRRRKGRHSGLLQCLSWSHHGQPGRHPTPQVPGSVQAAHARRALCRIQRPGQRPRADGRDRLRHHRRADSGRGWHPCGHAGISGRTARTGRRIRRAADLRRGAVWRGAHGHAVGAPGLLQADDSLRVWRRLQVRAGHPDRGQAAGGRPAHRRHPHAPEAWPTRSKRAITAAPLPAARW